MQRKHYFCLIYNCETNACRIDRGKTYGIANIIIISQIFDYEKSHTSKMFEKVKVETQ